MAAVTWAAVWTGTKVDVVQPVEFMEALRRAKFGTGRGLVVRVEPEDEHWRAADMKHLFGHVYGAVVTYRGYTREQAMDLHAMAKARFLPAGKTSLTQLNRDEFKVYTSAVEQWLRDECADAFALVD